MRLSSSEYIRKLCEKLQRFGLKRTARLGAQFYLKLFEGDLLLNRLIGRLDRQSKAFLGSPASMGSAHDDTENLYQRITVIGPSLVRAIGGGESYLPLMIGAGKITTSLTPDLAAATERKVRLNLERVDRRFPVLLVLGNSDPMVHVRNDFGTWDLAQPTSGHESVMKVSAERITQMVARCRADFGLDVIFCLAFPMVDGVKTHYVNIINKYFKLECERLSIPYIDLTSYLADPATGNLKADMSSVPGDDHIGSDLADCITQELQVLVPQPISQDGFTWNELFRFKLNGDDETRIWSEPYIGPTNAIHSGRVLFAQLIENVGTLISGIIATRSEANTILWNAGQGSLAFEIPFGVTRIYAYSADAAATRMARRIAHFSGRSDIEFETIGESSISDCANSRSICVLIADEGISQSTRSDFIRSSFAKGATDVVIFDNGDIMSTKPAGNVKVSVLPLHNRFLRGYWSTATLSHFSRR